VNNFDIDYTAACVRGIQSHVWWDDVAAPWNCERYDGMGTF